MPQTITRTSKDIVSEAMAIVPAISAEEALTLAGSTDHIFVDLRDDTTKAFRDGWFWSATNANPPPLIG